jgi:hypothetical protein
MTSSTWIAFFAFDSLVRTHKAPPWVQIEPEPNLIG